MPVFLALTLISTGRGKEAVAGLIGPALDRMDDADLQAYQWALRGTPPS